MALHTCGGRLILPSVGLSVLLLALTACASAPDPSRNGHTGMPTAANIEPTGFATVLRAPPSTASTPRPPRVESESERIARGRGISLAEAELLMNPDEAATRDATALDQRLKTQAAGNYIAMRIVRDPNPRFTFQFRRNATATLARFTSDRRFVAAEGGVPREELQPLFDEWQARFEPHILGAGSVNEFDGMVQFDMTIDETSYRAIAAREGWILPERVRLHFPPPPNTRPVDPALAPLVRVFARQDRSPGVVLSAALSGRLILRDGCFRMQEHGAGEPLVLFGRDVELGVDEDGYMVVTDPRGSESYGGPSARVGERVVWSGPRGVDATDEGVKALRAACGSDPIVAVGEPRSERRFELSLPTRR
jgi:hypothetical protein